MNLAELIGEVARESSVRQFSKSILSSIMKYKCNRFREASACFFCGAPLPVGSEYFGAVCYEPASILFEYGGEFVNHSCTIVQMRGLFIHNIG